jgi:hypothetical protein
MPKKFTDKDIAWFKKEFSRIAKKLKIEEITDQDGEKYIVTDVRVYWIDQEYKEFDKAILSKKGIANNGRGDISHIMYVEYLIGITDNIKSPKVGCYLKDIDNIDSIIEDSANRCLNIIEAIPQSYEVLIKIPHDFIIKFGLNKNTKISDSISIKKINSEEKKAIIKNIEEKNINKAEPIEDFLSKNSLYFMFSCSVSVDYNECYNTSEGNYIVKARDVSANNKLKSIVYLTAKNLHYIYGEYKENYVLIKNTAENSYFFSSTDKILDVIKYLEDKMLSTPSKVNRINMADKDLFINIQRLYAKNDDYIANAIKLGF